MRRKKGNFRIFKIALLAVCGAVAAFTLTGGCTTTAIRPNAKEHEPPRKDKLTVTGYCNCQKCCGWHYTWYGKPIYAYGKMKGERKRVGITASGSRTRHGVVAADTSRYPFGTIMEIPGYGFARVEDVGGAIKGARLDVWFSSHKDALEWGKRTMTVKVWLPKHY